MAITQYTSDTGKAHWKAYVSVKSKSATSIRIQRWRFGVKTERQAAREEAALRRECYEEITDATQNQVSSVS